MKMYNCNVCHETWSKPSKYCPRCHSNDIGLYPYGICKNCKTGDFIEDRPLYDDLCPDCFRNSISDDIIKQYFEDALNGKTPITTNEIIYRCFPSLSNAPTQLKNLLLKAILMIFNTPDDDDKLYYMPIIKDYILDDLDRFYEWYSER